MTISLDSTRCYRVLVVVNLRLPYVCLNFLSNPGHILDILEIVILLAQRLLGFA